MRRTLIALAILVVLPGFAWSAQSGSPSGKQQEPLQAPQDKPKGEAALQTAEGELTRMDADKQLIWIRTADDKEMQFSYTKQTAVEGTGGTAEGLGEMKGSYLTIDYKSEGGVNTAVKIAVQPASAQLHL
jgi:hypothetical protein